MLNRKGTVLSRWECEKPLRSYLKRLKKLVGWWLKNFINVALMIREPKNRCVSIWITKKWCVSLWRTKRWCVSHWRTKIWCTSQWRTKKWCVSHWCNKNGCTNDLLIKNWSIDEATKKWCMNHRWIKAHVYQIVINKLVNLSPIFNQLLFDVLLSFLLIFPYTFSNFLDIIANKFSRGILEQIN